MRFFAREETQAQARQWYVYDCTGTKRKAFRFLFVPRRYRDQIVWLETALVEEDLIEQSENNATGYFDWKVTKILALKGDPDYEKHAQLMSVKTESTFDGFGS